MHVEMDEIVRLNCLLNIYVDANVDKDFSVLSKNEDPFFIFNRTGQLVYVNELCETLLEYSKSELVHMKLGDMFNSTVLNEKQTFFLEKKIEKLVNFDSQVKSKQGNILDVNVTIFPILFDEDIVGSYTVLEDVTTIKKTRQRISQKQALAGQLAAGIAHEIRNPITAIKGFLHLMTGDQKEKETTYYKIIDSEINRIEEILKELMVLAKPTNVKYEKLDISLLVQQVLSVMDSQALLNNVQIKSKYQLNGEKVLGDENQLKQVFINYLKNAIEAMPGGGTIELEVFHQSGQVQVRIIDQGTGIPQEILNRIYEPFFTTKDQGNGLGLAVSSQIITEHKGEVNISSTSTGTCVEVKLPAINL